jgi:hypothetical protein
MRKRESDNREMKIKIDRHRERERDRLTDKQTDRKKNKYRITVIHEILSERQIDTQ